MQKITTLLLCLLLVAASLLTTGCGGSSTEILPALLPTTNVTVHVSNPVDTGSVRADITGSNITVQAFDNKGVESKSEKVQATFDETSNTYKATLPGIGMTSDLIVKAFNNDNLVFKSMLSSYDIVAGNEITADAESTVITNCYSKWSDTTSQQTIISSLLDRSMFGFNTLYKGVLAEKIGTNILSYLNISKQDVINNPEIGMADNLFGGLLNLINNKAQSEENKAAYEVLFAPVYNNKVMSNEDLKNLSLPVENLLKGDNSFSFSGSSLQVLPEVQVYGYLISVCKKDKHNEPLYRCLCKAPVSAAEFNADSSILAYAFEKWQAQPAVTNHSIQNFMANYDRIENKSEFIKVTNLQYIAQLALYVSGTISYESIITENDIDLTKIGTEDLASFFPDELCKELVISQNWNAIQPDILVQLIATPKAAKLIYTSDNGTDYAASNDNLSHILYDSAQENPIIVLKKVSDEDYQEATNVSITMNSNYFDYVRTNDIGALEYSGQYQVEYLTVEDKTYIKAHSVSVGGTQKHIFVISEAPIRE